MALGLFNRATHALRWWLLRTLPTCQQMTRVMSESFERPLTLRERVTLRLHLWVCIWCVWYLEHLRTLRGALRLRASKGEDSGQGTDVALSREARERIKRALQSQKP